MTEANRESLYRDGEKRDLRIEDLLTVWVADEVAGAVDEDILEGAWETFFLTMVMKLEIQIEAA